jgi:hypothetical protein
MKQRGETKATIAVAGAWFNQALAGGVDYPFDFYVYVRCFVE